MSGSVSRTPEQRARHAQLERERRRRLNGGPKDTRKLFAEVGQRFGRGVVIEPEIRIAAQNKRGARLCCDCGTEYESGLVALFGGKARSCGCLQRELAGQSAPRTHGLTRHPLYVIWGGMMHRCYEERDRKYEDYGGRGITVCPEWHDVKTFIDWIEVNLGPRPDAVTKAGRAEYSIDRIDVNGNYEPGNVRWATWSEQARNRRVRRDIAELPERLRQGRVRKAAAEYEEARKQIERTPEAPEVLAVVGGAVMSEAAVTPATGQLFKALAQLQAELPEVGKGNTANTGTYTYKYADLADVSAAVMPLLGKLGLAFTAKPTLLDGKFVLAYSLVHVSGEREDGIYPLASNGTPQQMGAAITYARRYCLCAVTGVAPGGDDEDAHRQSAGGAWENSTAARPAGQVTRPAQQQASPQPADIDEAVVADWAAKVDEILTADDADRTDGELREVFKAGRMNPTTANAIRKAIKAKREAVNGHMAGASS